MPVPASDGDGLLEELSVEELRCRLMEVTRQRDNLYGLLERYRGLNLALRREWSGVAGALARVVEIEQWPD